jgi:nicotinamide-nucleotide amidase
MNAIIVNIGDELLIGQVVNTNASFMASHLSMAGVHVKRIMCIPDDETSLIQTLDRYSET